MLTELIIKYTHIQNAKEKDSQEFKGQFRLSQFDCGYSLSKRQLRHYDID